MKKLSIALVLAISITTGALAVTNPIKKTINVKESSITWTGKKVLGQHTGTIALKSGELIMTDDQLTGGSFVVDMTTINVTDLESGKGKEKLEGHLNSADFFDTSKFTEATFTFTKVTKNGGTYNVKGDLTIKGHTESIDIIMTLEKDTATTNLDVDRTKYGVRYGSSSFFDNLKDNAISDTFELAVILKL